ncbi:MAG: hypothetical protein AAB074_05305 [Planctomycetota bacterium]
MARQVVEIREEVLTFDTADQEKWVGGDKWLVPEEFRDDPKFAKSSRSYFLEMTAVHHYRCGGWQSLSALWFELWTKSANRKPWVERGSAAMEAFIGPELEGFRKSMGPNVEKFAKAPDLVIWKETPRKLLFLSIKQKNETVSPNEFAGLALIKAHLGADARIIRFCELGDFRDPRKWRIVCPSLPVNAGFDRHDVQKVEE